MSLTNTIWNTTCKKEPQSLRNKHWKQPIAQE